jgi:adenylate cyclase
VLQAASVIGKEFPEPILAQVAELPGAQLGDALRALKDAEFIFEQSLYPVTEYAFKHPLTQEVALGSQLGERRKRTHGAVARAILSTHAEHLDEEAALLAHHYEAAGELLDAVQWHRRAAEWLLQSDPSEARSHWRRVRELAAELPSSADVAEHELWACDRLLSNAWRVAMHEDEQEALAARGRILAQQLRDPVAASVIESGLAIARVLHGKPDYALEPARRSVELAEGLGVARRVEAFSVMIDAYWQGGLLEKSLRATEESLEISAGHGEVGKERYGVELTNWTLGRKGILLQALGRLEEAGEVMERSLAIARDRDEREAMAWLLAWGGVFQAAFTGVLEQVLPRALQCFEIAEQVGSPLTVVVGHLAHGWALLLAGQTSDALEPLGRAHALQEGFVFRSSIPITEALLTEAHLAAGNEGYAREFAERCDRDYGARAWEIFARLARARALRALDGRKARDAIAATLTRAGELLEESGAGAFAPRIAEERARLAGLLGDAEAQVLGLDAARAGYEAIGAIGHAERLAAERRA